MAEPDNRGELLYSVFNEGNYRALSGGCPAFRAFTFKQGVLLV